MSALGTGLTSQLVGAAAPMISSLIDKNTERAGGAVGTAIGGLFGKKGKKVGAKVGKELFKIGRKFLPFQEGGKVRHPPSAYKKGGKIKKSKKSKK
jgi:hypothetical protein